MSLDSAQTAVFEYVKANPVTGAPWVYQNSASESKIETDHLRVQVLTVPKFTQGLSSGPVTEPYIIQIDVMTRRGVGSLNAGRLAKAALALFPRGLTLNTNDGEVVRFDVEGSEAPSIPGSAWYQVPVSIPCYILR